MDHQLHVPHPHKAQGPLKKRAQKDCKSYQKTRIKQCLPDNRTTVFMTPQHVCTRLHKIIPGNILAQRREGFQSPTPN